jgi:hypothetical protein
MPKRTPSLEEYVDRFWGRVNKTDGCWLWTAGTRCNGYGRFEMMGVTYAAHRLSYMLCVSPIPDGLQIDHLCRNHGCVNPDHLEAVTPQVNTLRGYGPGGEHARRSHCNHGHEFTPENTYFHRIGRSSKRYRVCKECMRIKYAANRAPKNQEAA